LSDNNAVLEPVKLNDHNALGVIDNFAKNLKRVLSKEFLENKSTEWVSILPKIIALSANPEELQFFFLHSS
jgi:hypothetical protein